MIKAITLVLGASLKPSKYSNKAVRRLTATQIPVLAVGLKSGCIDDTPVISFKEAYVQFDKEIEIASPSIDTISLYLSPKHQESYIDLILDINPRRVIFNPGTENLKLTSILQEHGIFSEIACTLVLLATNQYETHES